MTSDPTTSNVLNVSKVTPTGSFVGTTDTQTLTNKTLGALSTDTTFANGTISSTSATDLNLKGLLGGINLTSTYNSGTPANSGTINLNANSPSGKSVSIYGSPSYFNMQFGRNSSEANIGIASSANQFVNGSVNGDITIGTSTTGQNVLIGSSSQSYLSLNSLGGTLNGVFTPGSINSTGTITTTNNISGFNITGSGLISTTNNITASGILTGQSLNITGSASNSISTGGGLSVTGNYTSTNGNITLTNGTISAANVIFTSPIPVSSGGTGVGTLTSGYLLQGNGTSAVTSPIQTSNVGLLNATQSWTGTTNTFSNAIKIPGITSSVNTLPINMPETAAFLLNIRQ